MVLPHAKQAQTNGVSSIEKGGGLQNPSGFLSTPFPVTWLGPSERHLFGVKRTT